MLKMRKWCPCAHKIFILMAKLSLSIFRFALWLLYLSENRLKLNLSKEKYDTEKNMFSFGFRAEATRNFGYLTNIFDFRTMEELLEFQRTENFVEFRRTNGWSSERHTQKHQVKWEKCILMKYRYIFGWFVIQSRIFRLWNTYKVGAYTSRVE